MHSLLTPRRAELWRATQAAAAPVPPAPAPRYGLAYRLAIHALRLVFVLLVLFVLALAFVLLGEERPERVRPELTPAQRARAFRLPTD